MNWDYDEIANDPEAHHRFEFLIRHLVYKNAACVAIVEEFPYVVVHDGRDSLVVWPMEEHLLLTMDSTGIDYSVRWIDLEKFEEYMQICRKHGDTISAFPDRHFRCFSYEADYVEECLEYMKISKKLDDGEMTRADEEEIVRRFAPRFSADLAARKRLK